MVRVAPNVKNLWEEILRIFEKVHALVMPHKHELTSVVYFFYCTNFMLYITLSLLDYLLRSKVGHSELTSIFLPFYRYVVFVSD